MVEQLGRMKIYFAGFPKKNATTIVSCNLFTIKRYVLGTHQTTTRSISIVIEDFMHTPVSRKVLIGI